jgi:Uma2 family endonuclease
MRGCEGRVEGQGIARPVQCAAALVHAIHQPKNAFVPRPHRFTNAEFTRLAQSGGLGELRVELRRGMIVEMSPQHLPHLMPKTDMADALKAAIRAAGLNWRVDTESSVDFPDGFQPMPAIVVWDPALAGDLQGALPGAAVKLIVEVGSTSLEDDLGEKLKDYAHGGLREYWVVDVKARALHRFEGPGEAGFARRLDGPLAEGFASLLHPNMAVAVGTIGLL